MQSKAMEKLVVAGKRKTAIAKAAISRGEGNVRINGKPYQLLSFFHRLAIEEPIKIAKQVLGEFNFDIDVKVRGGGIEGQIEAARLAIAKALVKFTRSNELKKSYLAYDRHLLIADTRRKETRKPRDSKARAKRQQ